MDPSSTNMSVRISRAIESGVNKTIEKVKIFFDRSTQNVDKKTTEGKIEKSGVGNVEFTQTDKSGADNAESFKGALIGLKNSVWEKVTYGKKIDNSDNVSTLRIEGNQIKLNHNNQDYIFKNVGGEDAYCSKPPSNEKISLEKLPKDLINVLNSFADINSRTIVSLG
jgi:hypothetical protein